MNKHSALETFSFISIGLVIASTISPLTSISISADMFVTKILSSIACPFLLMLAGSCILGGCQQRQWMHRILIIYLFVGILYLPASVAAKTIDIPALNIGVIIRMLMFEGDMYHLWIFPAMLIGTAIVYTLCRLNHPAISWGIVLMLYAIGLFGDSWSGTLSGSHVFTSFYWYIYYFFAYTKNGLFFAPVFIYMGYWLRNRPINQSCGTLFIFSFAGMIIESLLLQHFTAAHSYSMYLFLLPSMYYLFQMLKDSSENVSQETCSICTLSYLLYPYVILLINSFSNTAGINYLLKDNHLILFLLTVFLTFSASYGTVRIINRRKTYNALHSMHTNTEYKHMKS
jgi:serine/alanine racemase